MASFEDLTNYSYMHYENSKNIGWLSEQYPYPKGKVSEEFIDNLWIYLHVNISKVRGQYGCDLCSQSQEKNYKATYKGRSITLGFDEIRVLSEDGKTAYAAPNLIYHYILEHDYRPPEEFIQAVLKGPKPGTREYEKFLASFTDYILQGGNDDIEITLWGENNNNIEIAKQIHDNITKGNLENIISLVNSIPEKVNMIIDYSNWLYIAVSEGKLEIVEYLISYGAKMDIRNASKNPLFRAIYGGYVDIAKLLIEKGIDTKIKYNTPFMRNMDALKLAYKKGQNEIIKLLESKL